MTTAQALLEVQDLKKYFPVQKGVLRRTVGYVKAVDGVSFRLQPGETLGIVGESGCGKSTLARTIMRVLEPTAGKILLDGQDISQLSGKALRRIRRKFQMVFQDPYASLNPRMSVQDIIAEPLVVNGLVAARDIPAVVADLLEKVGLKADDRQRYPHEFSGGQRQRIGIARAIAVQPRLIVADEAVSALDVSIQAQILNLMQGLKQELGLSYVFISHNLAVVRYISDQVGVMYLGHLVELTTKQALYQQPLHPYSEALLSAALEPSRKHKRERILLRGDVPNPAHPPTGCPFHTRCPKVMDVCRQSRPTLREAAPGHWVACHLH